MPALPLPAGTPEPSAFCSTRIPGRIVRPQPSRLGVPEVVVVVVVVLVLAALAADNRSVPAALVVVAGAVADLITGRRLGVGTAQRRRRGR